MLDINTSPKFTKIFLGLALVAASVSVAQAQSKAAYVDRERIIKEVNIAKQAQEKLKAEFKKREDELIAQDKRFKEEIEKYRKEAPSLVASEREKRQTALAQQEQEFQEKQRQFQEDLAVRKGEELQKVLDAAQKALEKIAKEEKIDFVLVDAVAYFNPSLDITERVIRALNSQ